MKIKLEQLLSRLLGSSDPKAEEENLIKSQEQLDKLEECNNEIKATDDMLRKMVENSLVESLPLDLSISCAKVALRHKSKLNNWGDFIKLLAAETTARGYNYKTLLKDVL